MGKKRLTTWEAACIITGYGVGGGVLSMPYLAEKAGLLPAVVILIISLAASYILHLMIADLALKASEGGQIIACLSQFLFRGRLKKFLSTMFFVLMTLILFTNLAAYISGAEEILVGFLPIPGVLATLIFYVIAASVVLFGLKAVGVSEKISVAVIFGLIGALAVASFFAPSHALTLTGGSVNGALAFYGMAMFAMAAFFSVPQAVEGLNKDKKQIQKAVFLGLLNNFIIIVVITFCALLSSDEVTEVAMVGWSAGIGTWAQIVGGLFTVLAMLTTYWSLSLALGSIVAEQMKWDARLCWLIATLPSLILALLNLASFMEFMRLAGGFISIIIAIMVVPAYLHARREGEGSILTHGGGKVTAVLIMIAYILMGIGSVVPV
jgi:amino acid permease